MRKQGLNCMGSWISRYTCQKEGGALMMAELCTSHPLLLVIPLQIQTKTFIGQLVNISKPHWLIESTTYILTTTLNSAVNPSTIILIFFQFEDSSTAAGWK